MDSVGRKGCGLFISPLTCLKLLLLNAYEYKKEVKHGYDILCLRIGKNLQS